MAVAKDPVNWGINEVVEWLCFYGFSKEIQDKFKG